MQDKFVLVQITSLSLDRQKKKKNSLPTPKKLLTHSLGVVTMAKIVNDAHFGRLEGLLSRTKGQIVHGGELDREASSIGLTIVKDVDKDDSLMSDEIFGPLLPVLRVDTLDQAVDLIRQSEIPLALYSLRF